MRAVPKFLKETLDNSKEAIAKCGDKLKDINEVFLLARGYLYAIALETALKIQETCYIKSKRYAISDFYHGPLAFMILVSQMWLVLGMILDNKYIMDMQCVLLKLLKSYLKASDIVRMK